MKNHITKILIAGILLIIILLAIFLVGCPKDKNNDNGSNQPITFKDKQFEKMIQKELDKDEIYKSDLSEISGIMIASDRIIGFSGGGHKDKSVVLFGFDEFEYEDVRYKEFGTIKTLEDLENFPKLTSIRIYLQPNIDFNTIPNKANITNLGLSQNKISSLDFLEGFDKLLYLSISSNSIVELKGIENTPTLKRLGLNSNDVKDISLLSNFKDLEHLDLTYNNVLDVSPIKDLPKLEYISLYENGISDITPLASIKSLKQLFLNNNKITDISPLKDFTSFEDLNISGNPITNYEAISHITNTVK